MNYEVRTYRFICNQCKKVEFVRDVPFWSRPDGWGTMSEHDCGSTGYTRTDDLCTECYKKLLHQKAIRNVSP